MSFSLKRYPAPVTLSYELTVACSQGSMGLMQAGHLDLLVVGRPNSDPELGVDQPR